MQRGRCHRRLGRSFRFVELANGINDHMPDHAVGRVTDILNRQGRSVQGNRILLLRLAYTKNSADLRESPAARASALLADLPTRTSTDLAGSSKAVSDLRRRGGPLLGVTFATFTPG
ncbi:hypothetical protein CC117_00875 [Parafrankia colletiae]|uniref:Uncharacterized protein n=1 Tax=Parafrankia colletiae TaxID=573497 RepID=A0A1S1RHI3_9ACTN|nr:hypothetical protein [Parafrankia colletiae]OHV46238.1 hypothetical protein CC117_00875 [Parafrankia colletiae]